MNRLVTDTLRRLREQKNGHLRVTVVADRLLALIEVAEAAREMREATRAYEKVTSEMIEAEITTYTTKWHIASAAELNATARLDEALEALAKVEG